MQLVRVNRLGRRGGGRGATKFDFTNGASLHPSITFSRASSAIYRDSTGTIKTAASGVARSGIYQDYDPSTLAARGFLIEEQRTNLLLQNTDFNTTWTKAGSTPAVVTTNTTTSPDGTTTADTVAGIGSASDRVSQTVSVSNSTTYVLSFFVKNINAVSSKFHIANTSSGTANSETTIGWTGTTLSSFSNTGTTVGVSVQYPNGWYRVYFKFTTNGADAGTSTVRFYPNGDGADGNTKSVYLWGAQLEVGGDPSSLIYTTTGTAARLADVATVSGASFTNIWNASGGTLFVDAASYDTASGSGSNRAISVSDNTTSNYIDIARGGSGSQIRATVVTSGVSQSSPISTAWAVNTFKKAASAFAANDFAAVLGGGTVATDASGTLPTVDRLHIGNVAGGNQWNGWIKSIAIYKKRLSNTTIQTITT